MSYPPLRYESDEPRFDDPGDERLYRKRQCALAYRAYQNWETKQPVPEAAPAQATSVPQTGAPAGYLPPPPPADSRFNVDAAPAKDGKTFELALVLAMIAAAPPQACTTTGESLAFAAAKTSITAEIPPMTEASGWTKS